MQKQIYLSRLYSFFFSCASNVAMSNKLVTIYDSGDLDNIYKHALI